MAKKNYESQSKEKIKLGLLIRKNREKKGLALRQLSKAINIPPSNMTYIEQGKNGPTPEIYGKIVEALNPTMSDRKKMDELYSMIRQIPPPDVCNVFIQNPELVDVFRKVGKSPIPEQKIKAIEALLLQ